ncbi:DUF5686 and carboxypeptidase-like regulatory domain-containing protein [Massilibacteroides vaginae]|uniref:DUF5686 and carboxypeptidase-like regulatory domain-containing protein n=1 Tax=Massilibacteroides vaginae TaxID=1673718 RepID=UPI001FE5D120|nr:DUF5686 and carboxypeptidase-like regulatory domain-containing protein [Massilibacteroides vaginae]
MDRVIWVIFFLGVQVGALFAQSTPIKGVVADSITGEKLAYVSILLEGTSIGTTTADNGTFSLNVPSKKSVLLISYLGYREKRINIVPGKSNNLKIELAPSTINLNEIVIKPKKEKYTKKENPAVLFIRKAIEAKEYSDPKNHDFFSYNKYENIVLALNQYRAKKAKSEGKFGFLSDFVDTVGVDNTVLPLSEKEKYETMYYRKSPKSEKSVIHGLKANGVDEMFTQDGMQQILNEVFREVDLFQNDIPLFLNRFVSPLSSIGPSFYKYYLLDTLEFNNQKCVDLGFVPFNSESFGFTGHLYITLDSTYFVQHAQLNVPKDINLNFVNQMSIEQSFERREDGTRIITKDDISVVLNLTSGPKGIYARRLNVYSDHSFEEPSDLSVFDVLGANVTAKDAALKPDDFWLNARPDELNEKSLNRVAALMKRLREIPVFYVTEKVVSALVAGYIPTHVDPKKSKFEFGPMNTMISANAIEGTRFRLGGTTMTALSKRFFLDGYAAYGTKDKEWKYDIIGEYSFIDKTEFRKEFPVHSLRFEYIYDINQLGQHYLYTNKDNMFLAFKRQKDDRATYLRNAELTYTREYYNNLSYKVILRNKKEYATPYAEFNQIAAEGQVTPLNDYKMSELELGFRYAPNEKFYESRNYRYPVTFDAPVFSFSHIIAGKGVLGSDYTYNRTDLAIQKRFWFSAFGYLDVIGKTGKVWNKVPYPLLILPNANLSYTIQPESYTNMNAIEFINDEYVSWDITYYANGLLLNRIPLLKKMKLREVFSFRGLYGNLTDKNNPWKKGEGLFAFPERSHVMGDDPYLEAGVGVENILKFFRLDYVWRMTYLDNPGIDKHGLRFSFVFKF